MKQRTISRVAQSLLLLSSTGAWAAVDTHYWSDLDVNVVVTYPDAVTRYDPFSISFNVDSTDSSAYMLAFLSNVTVSDTVSVAGGTWEWEMVSTDPAYNNTYTGSLGDSTAPYTYTSGTGYEFNLADPFFGQYGSDYTWLSAGYEDEVTWTLNFPMIDGNTDFEIMLDASIGWGSTTTIDFTVIDPPAAAVAAVPLPAAYLLYLSGAGLLFLAGRRRG